MGRPSHRSVRYARRGIYLAAALLIAVIVCIFLGAALALAPGWFNRARLHSNQDRAEQAALSGAEYVLARLRQNPQLAYGGIGNTGRRVTVDTPEMYVVEDHGNIVGLIWDEASADPAQFRLRFNYQDGAGTEQLDDPQGDMLLDLPSVSLNNVPGSSDRLVPATEDGGAFAVTSDSGTANPVPPRAVYLAIEGRAGSALAALSRANPNASLSSTAVSRKLLQGVYKIRDAGQPVVEAVAASSGDLHFDLPPGQGKLTINSSGSEPARLRAKGEIAVEGGGNPGIDSPRLAQLRSPGQARGNKSSRVSEATENSSDPFYRIGWSDVAGSPDGTLKAGVYVVGESGQLTYFDMTPEEYVSWISDPENAGSLRARQGDDYTLPRVVTFEPANQNGAVNELRIEGSVEVEPTQNTSSFAFMPRRGAAAAEPEQLQQPVSFNTLNEEQFYALARTHGESFSAEGSAGQEFGRALHNYLYTYQLANNAQLDPMLVHQTLQVTGKTVDVSVRPDGTFSIQNLPEHSVRQFLRELARLNPPEASRIQSAVESALEAGAGHAVPGSTDRVSTADLRLRFEGRGDSKARLRCPGKVVIGAEINGTGGAVVAEDDIDLYGFGGEQSTLSLYSKQDINIRTFYQAQIDASGRVASCGYRDALIHGVLYAWGNINALLGSPLETGSLHKLDLSGSMTSYGGDPASHSTPVTAGSFIYIKAREASLDYDPSSSLNLLDGLPANLKFTRSSWSIQ